MASQKYPRLSLDELAEFRRQAQQHFFDEWPSILKGEQRPTTRELRAIGLSMFENPLSIDDPDKAPYIYLIIQSWLAKTKAPSRPFSGKEIAAWVDRLIDRKVPKTKARQVIANALGMTFDAVKQDHLRHGSRRDRSR